MPALPPEIEKALNQDFLFQEKPVFCQLATQSAAQPHVRTVRLYGIEEHLGLIFLTRTTSKKWEDIKNNKNIALCMYQPERRLQLRAEGEANFFHYATDADIMEKYWALVSADIKKIYSDSFVVNTACTKEQNVEVPTIIPLSFSMFFTIPRYWESLLIHLDDQSKSIRYQYSRDIRGDWVPLRVNLA